MTRELGPNPSPEPLAQLLTATGCVRSRGQVTESGSAYRLGQPASDLGGVRRSSRAAGRDSLLDAFADTVHHVDETSGSGDAFTALKSFLSS